MSIKRFSALTALIIIAVCCSLTQAAEPSYDSARLAVGHQEMIHEHEIKAFYKVNPCLACRGDEFLGSPVFGYIAAFFLDPISELSHYIRDNDPRNSIKEIYSYVPVDGELPTTVSSCFFIHPFGLNPGAGIKFTVRF